MTVHTSVIDVIEDDLVKIHPSILKILLEDKTTYKNIIWATHDYESLGQFYYPYYEIRPEQITGMHREVIQPRICKSLSEQIRRTKNKAEVFTPAWICNYQNNLIDEDWFGRKNVFNYEKAKKWKSNPEKITFPNNKNWKNYIDTRRLEVSCGEAPYLVSRYDSALGVFISIKERIGMLDRKMRVLNENATSKDEWIKWAIRAFQSVYGFEFQGDSLLLARENLLLSFIDYYEDRFNDFPDIALLKKIGNIISWNLWQMDGLNYQIPYPNDRKHQIQTNILEELDDSHLRLSNTKQLKKLNEYNPQIKCRIFDWRSNCSLEFESLFKANKNN